MALIKGITVQLLEEVKTGVDDFGEDIYEEIKIDVENVLVYPSSDTDIVDSTRLYGKTATYTMCIPKGDTHKWGDSKVIFFGKTWQVFGMTTEYIENQVPLEWNKKVLVEAYNG